jgi:hypothetical protein
LGERKSEVDFSNDPLIQRRKSAITEIIKWKEEN